MNSKQRRFACLIGLIGCWIVLVLSGCSSNDQRNEKYFTRTYVGYWGDTFWRYEFKDNGRFVFSSNGHLGSREQDSGFYLIKDDLLILNPETDWRVINGALSRKLKIVNNCCVRDFQSNFYCEMLDSTTRFIEGEVSYQSKMERILDTCRIVRNEKARVLQYNPSEEFHILYEGIVMVEGKELHSFSLTGTSKGINRRYLFFLADKLSEVYQYNWTGERVDVVFTLFLHIPKP